MKMRVKFTLGLSVILISLALALNILIRQELTANMETSINTSLEEIMKSSREYIKYRLAVNDSLSDGDEFMHDAVYIAKYISINYECSSQIADMKGKIIQDEGNKNLKDVIARGVKQAETGKAVANLKYSKNDVQGILSFPIYINSNYLGIITINKDYKELYSTYYRTISFITIVEAAVFFIIFILAFLMTTKITKPITLLTKAVKQVGEGDYNIELKIKSKDEVAQLSKEFINMKDKINEHIQTIEREKEKVEKLEDSRRLFFNNVTHELKTPLTAISGYAETLLEEIVVDEQFKKRAIERIYSESQRLHKLVLELIDVSKGISSVEEDKKAIDMQKLLNEICEDMNIKAKKYSLQICRTIAEGSVFGQEYRIRELLINIIDNAIKYSINGGSIFVKANSIDGCYFIEIQNKAEKIPEDIFNNIFDPFVGTQKLSEERSRGLGLYICSEIVKQHNGEITIENGQIITTKIKLPSCGNNLETNL